jgi:hypothetical protein
LDDRAHAGVFVGYDENAAAYRVYIPQTRKIMKSGHVIFNERGRMDYGSIMDNADIDDWFLGLDENGNSVIRVYGGEHAPVPRDSVGGDAVVPEQDGVEELLERARLHEEVQEQAACGCSTP